MSPMAAGAAAFTAAALFLSIPPSARADEFAPAAGVPAAPAPALTAEQIVEKSAQARGGLEAWRKLETIVWKGHLESDRLPERSVRFELTEKRPNKARFEILDPAEKSLRVFDGSRGWKMRAGQDGLPTVQSYSPMEIRYAREAPGLDGALIDFALKGKTVELDGHEAIDGRDCYRLSVRLASGEKQTVWVDSETFLETRYDRVAYGENGPRGIVSQFYRDYRVVEGMAMPSVIEIGGQGVEKRDRMVIEQVALNPKVPDLAFARPPGAPRGAEVTLQAPPMPRWPQGPAGQGQTPSTAVAPAPASGSADR
jgi:hypothetical protein